MYVNHKYRLGAVPAVQNLSSRCRSDKRVTLHGSGFHDSTTT
jgi:hypothetical protein